MAGIFSSLLGVGSAAPRVATSGSVVTDEALAGEIAPFYKDLLEKSQALHDSRLDEGYQPYQGQTVADLTQDEITAREGIRGLVGSQQADFDEARRLQYGQGEKFTAEAAQEYMNPYQQAVTDLNLRKAQENFSRSIMPEFEKFAIGGGGMSGLGSRAGVQAGILGESFMQNLADIQAKGSSAAFTDARSAFEAQKRREAVAGTRLPQLSQLEYGTKSKELSGLLAIGEDESARTQTSLDEAYKQFLEERRFPEDQLKRYQSTVQGFPNIESSVVTTNSAQPSGIQNFLSTASGLGSLYGTFGGFSEDGFGSTYSPGGTPKKAMAGGQVQQYAGGGLIDLPIVYQQKGSGNTVIDKNANESAFGRYLREKKEESIAKKNRGIETAPAGLWWEMIAGTADKSDAMKRDREQKKELYRVEEEFEKRYDPKNPEEAALIKEALRSQDNPGGQGLSPFGTRPDRDKDNSNVTKERREALRTAEVLNPGFRRDPESPTGYKLERPGDLGTKEIEAGSGGMGAEDMYKALPKGSSVIPRKPTISDSEKLYDLIIKGAKEKKVALTEAKDSKTKRNAARTEKERIEDLTYTLGRFSQNILDPNSNLGSAFGKATVDMAPTRKAAADRQAGVADTIDELNAKIRVAASEGDIQALTALIKAKKDTEELSIKRTTAEAAADKAKIAAQTAAFKRFIEKSNLNIAQAERLTKLSIAVAKGETNKETLGFTLDTIFKNDDSVTDDFLKDVLTGLLRITVDPKRYREPEKRQ